jgi:hypothetical protein
MSRTMTHHLTQYLTRQQNKWVVVGHTYSTRNNQLTSIQWVSYLDDELKVRRLVEISRTGEMCSVDAIVNYIEESIQPFKMKMMLGSDKIPQYLQPEMWKKIIEGEKGKLLYGK